MQKQGRYFGGSVAISEDTVMVGASGNTDNGINSGAVYIFTRSGSIWTQEAKLLANDGTAGDNFGSSVAISENTMIIGADNDNDYGEYAGSAYIFTRSGSIWTQEAKLAANDGEARDFFGTSVDINGNTAIIGAYQDDDNGKYSGSAYVFTRSGTSWNQQSKLLASDGAPSGLLWSLGCYK